MKLKISQESTFFHTKGTSTQTPKLEEHGLDNDILGVKLLVVDVRFKINNLIGKMK